MDPKRDGPQKGRGETGSPRPDRSGGGGGGGWTNDGSGGRSSGWDDDNRSGGRGGNRDGEWGDAYSDAYELLERQRLGETS